jgi:hypothetical protein
MVNLNKCRALLCAVVVLWGILCLAVPSSLSPRGTHVEQQMAKQYSSFFEKEVMRLGHQGVLHFAEPVHEEITPRIFGCEDQCDDAESAVEYEEYVIAGVRWNDDPPFRLNEGEGQHTVCKTDETIRFTTQPRCWYQIFSAAKKQAAQGDIPSADNHAPLLARSHFGDLQFFHAMASQDGEPASETQRRILIWVEFAWKVGSGDYKLDTKLSEVNIPGFDQFFGKSGWTVQDLFTSGNPALRRHIDDIAMGSAFHTVEDSFAGGHVQREETSPGSCLNIALPAPPRIIEFHSYGHQDEKKHKEQDNRAAFMSRLSQPVNVVTVGKPLADYYYASKKWEEVKPYFECIFTVTDANHLATAGQEFEESK